VAALLGIALPDILFAAAAVLLIGAVSGKWRKGAGAVVGMLGLFVIMPFGTLLLIAPGPAGEPRNMVLLTVTGLIALTGLVLTVIGIRAIFTPGQSAQ